MGTLRLSRNGRHALRPKLLTPVFTWWFVDGIKSVRTALIHMIVASIMRWEWHTKTFTGYRQTGPRWRRFAFVTRFAGCTMAPEASTPRTLRLRWFIPTQRQRFWRAGCRRDYGISLSTRSGLLQEPIAHSCYAQRDLRKAGAHVEAAAQSGTVFSARRCLPRSASPSVGGTPVALPPTSSVTDEPETTDATRWPATTCP